MSLDAETGFVPVRRRLAWCFDRALIGAALGCLVAVAITTGAELWPIFVTHLIFDFWLVLSGIIGALVTALVARFRPGPLSAGAVMIGAAALSFVIFWLPVLYVLLVNPGTTGGMP